MALIYISLCTNVFGLGPSHQSCMEAAHEGLITSNVSTFPSETPRNNDIWFVSLGGQRAPEVRVGVCYLLPHFLWVNKRLWFVWVICWGRSWIRCWWWSRRHSGALQVHNLCGIFRDSYGGMIWSVGPDVVIHPSQYKWAAHTCIETLHLISDDHFRHCQQDTTDESPWI